MCTDTAVTQFWAGVIAKYLSVSFDLSDKSEETILGENLTEVKKKIGVV